MFRALVSARSICGLEAGTDWACATRLKESTHQTIRVLMTGWRQLTAASVSIVALAAMVVPHDDVRVRLVGAVCAAAALAALLVRAQSHMRKDIRGLMAAASEMADGTPTRVVIPVVWKELAPLAEALEAAHGRVGLQLRLLEQQREDLAMYLSRTEERLRDPNAEARRSRIAQIGNLHAKLTVGGSPEGAAVLDISLETAVLGVKPAQSDRLVPGMPVRLVIHMNEQAFDFGDVVVLAPARGGLLDLKEWVFRFDPPLSPDRLPPGLAKALELRRAERIRPVAGNPAGATVICDLGRLPAQVVDVSSTGLGVSATLDAKRAARLGTSFAIQLHMPALGEVAILPVTLRNMAVRTEGVRMGLSFDETADQREVDKVRAWLQATRRTLAA
ncbi:MAG: PilZ domain-containing protein [Myxococcales bacterium]|nr:PilZ domain-containing protein [Myxococcales bacterium]